MDVVAVKDDEISVDRIMERLSKRALELDHEFHGPPAAGIIDTTKPSGNRRSEGESREALAVEFVKAAVVNDEVLQIMAGDDWNLKADYTITSHRAGLVAAPLLLLKRILRRFVRLYTDFIVIRQNRVNSYLVRLCTQLVREHVRLQLENAREIEALKDMVEKQQAKMSSSVAAINARFDNNEARLDLLRAELEVRAEAMREQLERDDDELFLGDDILGDSDSGSGSADDYSGDMPNSVADDLKNDGEMRGFDSDDSRHLKSEETGQDEHCGETPSDDVEMGSNEEVDTTDAEADEALTPSVEEDLEH
ncbi:MAG: hypothetical protein JW941_13070 [Candidatus Coatesbacteria bacterium]|nr:hypothetical protein [Candidatus Coatesbacteria bacterium]